VTLSNIAAGCELSLEEGDITAFQGPEAVIGARSAGEAGGAEGREVAGGGSGAIGVRCADSHWICSLVNAANSTLLGGGGVDYAIHKAAGGDLYDACRRIAVIGGTWADRCRVGEAAWTIPGRLRVKGVVHTVGPMYSHQSHDESAELLTKAYRTSLALASEHGASTIAFPAISCGAYGYPHESAADEAVAAIAGACAGFKSVHIVLYDGRYFGVWEAAMRRLQPRASSAPAMVVAAAPPKDLGSGADTLRAAAADRRRKRRPPGRYLTN